MIGDSLTSPTYHVTRRDHLETQNRGYCMNLCRANQNQYYHTLQRQKMVLFGKQIIISEATPKISNNSQSS